MNSMLWFTYQFFFGNYDTKNSNRISIEILHLHSEIGQTYLTIAKCHYCNMLWHSNFDHILAINSNFHMSKAFLTFFSSKCACFSLFNMKHSIWNWKFRSFKWINKVRTDSLLSLRIVFVKNETLNKVN